MSEETNNPERQRLEDLNIEEAAGRVTPPDLSKRILAAAERGAIDDAVTPISGAHSVPRSVRPPAGRRMTAALPRRNWQGAGIVVSAVLLFGLALLAFVVWKGPADKPAGRPDTAEQPKGVQPEAPGRTPKRSSSEESTEHEPEKRPEPDLQPQVEPEPREGTPEPEHPDDIVEQPKPESEPRQPEDVVEQPDPETKPAPEPEQPKETVEQPKPDDKSEVKPEAKLVAVASFSAEGSHGGDFGFAVSHLVRTADTEDWKGANTPEARGVKLDEERNVFWVMEGTQLKLGGQEVALTTGCQVYVAGEVSLQIDASGMHLELIERDIYVDNQHTNSTLRVTRGDFELLIGEGAAVIESTKSKLDIFCVEGEVSADGTIIPEGHLATLTNRGLSRIKEASRRDWFHPMVGAAPTRHLGIEEFDTEPSGNMISGRLEERTAEQLGGGKAGHVASDSGRDAAVAFRFDGDHATLRGESVRVRYRASGAQKLILQMFCPARNDNFGIDLEPAKAGEWHVLEIKLSDLRDRVSHKDAPPPGTVLSSFTLALTGQDDAQLEVDWVELVREPRYGE
ncbi:MAG: hypothetical protein H6841_01365 [Planctomycetes bacterium]|nr:hypothetical protein [Planctomycetota bacterium]MCB9935579.1 hypothetical protein [Planctomycetota bacterium]